MAKSNEYLEQLTLQQRDLGHTFDAKCIEAECLEMIKPLVNDLFKDADPVRKSRKTAHGGSKVQERKTEDKVGSHVQPNKKRHTEEALDVKPKSKNVVQEELNSSLTITTKTNENSDVHSKSKMEEESNVQQKFKTLALEGFCKEQKNEFEISSIIDTFKKQLSELIELEVNVSESAELLIEIANKQVC